MDRSTSMYWILVDYLNIIGVSFLVSWIVTFGLNRMSQKKQFGKSFAFGLMFVLIGFLLIVRFILK